MIVAMPRRVKTLEFAGAERNDLTAKRRRPPPNQSPIELDPRPSAKNRLRLRRDPHGQTAADQRSRVARVVLMPVRYDNAADRRGRRRAGERAARAIKSRIDEDAAIHKRADRDPSDSACRALHPPSRHVTERF